MELARAVARVPITCGGTRNVRPSVVREVIRNSNVIPQDCQEVVIDNYHRLLEGPGALHQPKASAQSVLAELQRVDAETAATNRQAAAAATDGSSAGAGNSIANGTSAERKDDDRNSKRQRINQQKQPIASSSSAHKENDSSSIAIMTTRTDMHDTLGARIATNLLPNQTSNDNDNAAAAPPPPPHGHVHAPLALPSLQENSKGGITLPLHRHPPAVKSDIILPPSIASCNPHTPMVPVAAVDVTTISDVAHVAANETATKHMVHT